MSEDFDAGTALDADAAADPGTLVDQAGTEPAGAATGATAAPEGGLETLIDPATLPEELKPHWGRMTQAYNKRLGALRAQEKDVDSLRQKAATVDRLTNDPAYARQVVEQMAQQLGMALTPPAAPRPQGTPASPGSSDVPAHVLQAVQAAMGDEPSMAFMVPVVAKAAWAVAQQSVAPLHQERQQQHASARQAEYTQMTEALTQQAPGWEQYEPEMHARVEWLRQALSGQAPLRHDQYGSVLELLYRWASGEQRATGTAAKRMQQAVLGKTTTGSAAPGTGPSTADLIAKASGSQDQWQIAFQAALREAAK